MESRSKWRNELEYAVVGALWFFGLFVVILLVLSFL